MGPVGLVSVRARVERLARPATHTAGKTRGGETTDLRLGRLPNRHGANPAA